MSALDFFKTNARWLLAGGLLAFGSGYGQTFFISIFAAEIMGTFNLSHGEWGGIYSLGTTASAIIMLWAGGLSDHFRARTLGAVFLALLATACLLMSQVSAIWALPFAIFALRFTGQGMLSHIAVVAVSRWFTVARGKALAVSSLGFSIGQALLPLIFVSLLAFIDWRQLWVLAAGITVLMIPILFLLLNKERTPKSIAATSETLGMMGRHWTRRQTLSHGLFWLALPAVIAPATFSTALFFQQVHLADTKGWEHSQFVALFPLYTLVSIGTTMLTGWAVDRWGTARLLPWYQIPMALSFLVFSYGDTLTMAAVAFVLMALMNGAGAVLASTFWPEFYGTRHLGSIKALATSVMVLGSAIGPAISGILIDKGINFADQMIGIAIYVIFASALAWLAMRRYKPN